MKNKDVTTHNNGISQDEMKYDQYCNKNPGVDSFSTHWVGVTDIFGKFLQKIFLRGTHIIYNIVSHTPPGIFPIP